MPLLNPGSMRNILIWSTHSTRHPGSRSLFRESLVFIESGVTATTKFYKCVSIISDNHIIQIPAAIQGKMVSVIILVH